MILLVSGIVLIFVFILTLVFQIIRIVNTASHRVITPTTAAPIMEDLDDSLNKDRATSSNTAKSASDTYALAEGVTQLIIELVFILFAILATFVLFRYVKSKYTSVPTSEQKAAQK
jgi:hypothetical protein